MANKALATRQKLHFRVEPAQKALLPRNPFALAAKQRKAGSHQKNAAAALRQAQKLALKKVLPDAEDS